VLFFYGLREEVKLSAKSVESAVQAFKEFFVSEGPGFMQGLQMIEGLETWATGPMSSDEYRQQDLSPVARLPDSYSSYHPLHHQAASIKHPISGPEHPVSSI
jgi:hypothetical protein